MIFENNISRAIDMNVFGGSQIGEKNKSILQLQQSFKFNATKLINLENLLRENIKSVQVLEEQIKTLQLACADNKEITNRLKNIEKNIPAIISRINTVESYYKDKP